MTAVGTAAARLHVLTAMSAPMAVVLRRGPAGKVASLGWNRATGEVTLGQWLAGRIYEYRCDLSPDGRHMVYFAARQSRAAGHRCWTAVSRAPYLRAIAFQPQVDTWGGGGAFTADGALWPGWPGEIGDGLRAAAPSAFPPSTDGVFTGDTHGARLRLRGWRHLGGESSAARHGRDQPGGGLLEHSYALSQPNRAIGSSIHHLALPGQARAATGWEWADLWGDQMQFASGGALWQAQLIDGQTDAPKLIHDFNPLKFHPVPDPYQGLPA